MSNAEVAGAQACLARAKVNLALHITGQRADGYHLLHSLVAFPDIGDRLSLEPAEGLTLAVNGPFSANLGSATDDNLVLKAAIAFAEAAGIAVPAVKLTLTKNLPVASGIGGGSTDAATTLRLLERHTGVTLSNEQIHALALSLGTDVPVCLNQSVQVMSGIGDCLEKGPALPPAGIVLINPNVAVSTPEIFKKLRERDNPPLPEAGAEFSDLSALTGYLRSCRNDMEPAAIELCPEISEVLAALKADPFIRFARMSGSGATCFGLCEAGAEINVARSLQSENPGWWIAAGSLT